MKKRFRSLIRSQQWVVVDVSRANLWNWQNQQDALTPFGNEDHYRELRSWCNSTFPKDTWEGRMTRPLGIKQFAFSNEKYATLFRLKWL